MGPFTLFDKSFLQMLNPDEAAIFDCLFSAVICPVFFAETLADLSKGGATPDPQKLVRDIAKKTPVISSYPNVTHNRLIENELRGQPLNLRGAPAIAQGKLTRDSSGRQSILYNESPEARAFNRWQDARFEDVEREFAATWRAALSRAEHAKLAMIARDVFAISETPKSLYDAGKIAKAVVSRTEQYETNIVAGCAILGVDDQDAAIGLSRWINAGRPPLASYYPYLSHCLSVDLFFHVAVDKTLISPDRASNKLDISYLYYLPFCQIFVSNDKLHKKARRCLLIRAKFISTVRS